MTKPNYNHPKFVINVEDKRLEEHNKRMWLTLTINKNLTDTVLVILKNPSRATKEISDKTVYNVTSYIYKNKDRFEELKNIGKVTILNLIPFYETYSNQLANTYSNVIDEENLFVINEFTLEHKLVIIAWGNHPKGLLSEFERLKTSVFKILRTNKTQIYYVDKLSNKGNPKHGQVWGYENNLLLYNS